MKWISAKIAALRQDHNLVRARRGIVLGARGIRAGAGTYFLDKVPFFHWIPAYSPKWIIGDAIAGSSVGMIILPQAFIYSQLAGVPIQQALLASWLPGLIYTVMGTARDVSTGPTLMVSLITGGFVRAIAPFGVPPALVAAVLSFCVGLWSLLFGLLNIGFIFDFLSLPIVLGFVSGLAQVLIVAQIAPILGLTGISPVFIQQMPEIIRKIGLSKPLTIAIAAASISILAILQFGKKKLGRRSETVRIIAMNGSLLILSISTTVSFFLNRNRTEPLWAVLGPISTEITGFQIPNMILFKSLLLPSLTLWIAITTEHMGVARCYGHLNKYKVDASQEMVYLGITNTINSFLGGSPVGGGDLARAALNSGSGVRTPLSGIFTSLTVFLAVFVGSPFLRYMPQAAVAAVILVSTINQGPPMSNIAKYWKLSFTDFAVFMFTFNVTMVATPETGIGLGLAITVFYTLFRLMFSRPYGVAGINLEDQYSAREPIWWAREDRIPAGTQVIRVNRDLIFVNAERFKRHVVDAVYTFNSGLPLNQGDNFDRVWSNRRDKHIEYLRRKANVSSVDTFTPRFRVLVLDFTSTTFVDASGMQALEDMKKEIRAYGGPDAEIRFVGMNRSVLWRFKRAGWTLKSPYEDSEIVEEAEFAEAKDLIFESLPHAIQYELKEEQYGFDDGLQKR